MTRLPLFTHIIISLLAMAVAPSCSKGVEKAVSEERVLVSFDVSGQTRSIPDSESVVNTLDFLSFRDGRLDWSGRVRDAASITASLPKGCVVDCYAVVNAPSTAFNGILTEAGFLSAKCHLSDNSESGLVMAGSDSGIFFGGESVSVDVLRGVCRVEMRKLTPALVAEPSFASAGVRIVRAYLINACGSVPYSMTATAGDWLNYGMFRGESYTDFINQCLVKDIEIGVDGSGELETDVIFYACPNPVDRNTKLVIELEIGGVVNYYPIPLPSMSCNRSYIINNVIINGFGSEGPDIEVSRESISFSVEVHQWEQETMDVNLI